MTRERSFETKRAKLVRKRILKCDQQGNMTEKWTKAQRKENKDMALLKETFQGTEKKNGNGN